ncbi:MAG: UDP-N-acetylmuramoyl-L-alanyl-D-glutamate--2,6-diaminopimelate ligase [Clostridia bacterium]|jgi:UDP-N-acetylmuramoyl-L-alanyl-D-glutamate--2,6-diaminopimelate ligase|nr:UDP-N-acetylmuramoyl-L-alanyl-D-glutamate--2,6-diaminopimelate ligase [Clostridia bacterium]MCI1999624.1 UDP-N-acetylmuramoyl-L-alanyl-D-glutamate--2,6-diaminopimelate ligase [Clostridia bacterium]MCI2013997.1 UDP-N-acetylmuramoyl-L-alanyl-D-glutamate--2,6-diaminopimelate ligase [Clostridia bacterium]
MKIRDLLESEKYELLKGSEDFNIEDVEYDSRNVKEGSLFVCITGFKTDGHKYIDSAVKNGAKALCVEKDVSIPEGITCVKVENCRHALAVMADNFYDHPSRKLNLIGVTGTNGKTTTTYLIKNILEQLGHKTGVIGTIGNCIGDKMLHAERTTPESLEIQELFNEMYKEGVKDVTMEVSSHSLDLHRVDGCDFDLGLFTNLTEDHLDYHKTMENYKKAKGILFGMCKNSVINIDDAAGEYMISVSKGKVLTTGIDNEEAQLRAVNVKMTSGGVEFDAVYKNEKHHIVYHVPGKFSVYNALAAIGAGIMMNVPFEDIVSGLENVKGVKGRFQPIKTQDGVTAIVDYSHTPDSLENMLKTAKEFVKGRIITVFGCGGDRDKMKRPIMGEIGGRLSDFCIITSDNPRSEEPAAIVDDVEVGMKKTDCPYEKIVDRREAIYKAINMAKPGDFVAVAGKGHEDYQIFADKTIHFDDAEVILDAFKEKTK